MGVALVLGWALDVRGGTVIVLLVPYVFMWFDARRVLFQFDSSGVRIGNVRLPWTDVTALVVAESAALGPQVLIGTLLRDGVAVPAGADVPPPDVAMPAQLHVAVERRKFDLGELTAKTRRYAPAHVRIFEVGTSAGHSSVGGDPYMDSVRPYASVRQPGPAVGALLPVLPATHGPRWSLVTGAMLTCAAVLAVLAAAMPLPATLFEHEDGTSKGGVFLLTEDVLGLDLFPAVGPWRGLLTWPSLLSFLGMLTIACRAIQPHARFRFLRVVGLLCAVTFPLVLVGNDVISAGRVSSFESGWWVLHLAALLGLGAFVAMDLTLARGRVGKS
ncbi:hypothetical protein NJL88_13270 [Streptomyces sp. DK15]|uniref:hypothetical protein n=1 Tax=Streptomyces sp. DK15 TaxID=2957499 RepID=UPI0029AD3513|nr:hypothetical protein [Streptomyces sp. DK15]MDX2391011.1 hypothetical protein [Streptomyces sp. DK15]